MKHLDYIDLSLSRIKNCLESMGNPQDRIKNIIHIAGTNGKGSTTSFVRYILEENGYSVNVYTSPHLVSYNERFRIKGKLITNGQLEAVQARLSAIKGYRELSIFEATTVIAFVIFLENEADFTILETGLGGRLDATNIIKNPILNIFTSISYDHQNFLGSTLDKIAFEKFGIMKKKAIAVSDYQEDVVIKGLKYMLKKYSMKGVVGGEDYTIEGNFLKYKNKIFNLARLGLKGKHQKNNASLAIVALLNIQNIKLEDMKIIRALEKTQWFGRMQKVSSLYGTTFDSKTILYLDGCHNIAGMRVLKQFIKETYQCEYKHDSINKHTSFQDIERAETLSTDLNPNIYIMLGMLSKKDLRLCLEEIKEINPVILPLKVEKHESYNIEEINEICEELGIKTQGKGDISQNLKNICQNVDKKVIFICGSLYLLGNVLKDNNLLPS